MSFSRILFATDFSADNARAFPYVIDLAHRHEAELHILHVRGSLAHAGLTSASYAMFDQYESLLEELAAEELAKLETPPGLNVVRTSMASPTVAAGIVTYAEESDASVIALASHGQSAVSRVLLGSIPEKLVRIAPCPVLVVPTREDAEVEAADPDVVIAPWDFSEMGEHGLQMAAALARASSAKLLLVHVVDTSSHPAFHLWAAPDLDGLSGLEPNADARMQAWREQHGDGLDVELLVAEGRPHRAISRLAQQRQRALVVVAAQGLGVGPNRLLGSVTAKLLRICQSPVLVVR